MDDLHGAAADFMSAGDRHKSPFWSVSLVPSFRGGEAGTSVQGWMLSLLLHGAALGASLVVLGDLKLVPEPEPFTWEVSFVDTPQPQTEQPAAAEPMPQPSKPVPPVQQKQPPTDTRPVEPEIVPPVKTVEPVQRIESVPQVVRETPPVERKMEEVKPVETIHEAVTAIPRSSQPVELRQEAPEPVAQVETKTVSKDVAPSEPTEKIVGKTVTQAVPPVQQQAVEPAVSKEPAPAPPQPIQEATLRAQPAQPAHGKKTDFGWLAQTLWDRVARLKRYPHSARLHHLEGRVVVRAVITETGELADVGIAESSGHQILDEDALEVIRRACPLKLRHPLGRPHVVVQVPINYRLEN